MYSNVQIEILVPDISYVQWFSVTDTKRIVKIEEQQIQHFSFNSMFNS